MSGEKKAKGWRFYGLVGFGAIALLDGIDGDVEDMFAEVHRQVSDTECADDHRQNAAFFQSL